MSVPGTPAAGRELLGIYLQKVNKDLQGNCEVMGALTGLFY